ncbi:MAG: hypothetical protein R8P61_06735 [Bacteroidia bacterium]|nr:hypothetical protein [Bacteroidia bacterium]
MTPNKAKGLYALFTQAELIALFDASIHFPIYRPGKIKYFSKRLSPFKNRRQGVYFLTLKGAVVYVGATMKGIQARCNFHQSNKAFDAVHFLALNLKWESITQYERDYISLFDPYFNDELFSRSLSCHIPREMIERQAAIQYDLQQRIFSEFA